MSAPASLWEVAEAARLGKLDWTQLQATIQEGLDKASAKGALLYRDSTRTLRALEGPLAGLPLVIKDTFATLDQPTTCGSRLLEGATIPYDANPVARLRAAGAALVGKANLDEFGMGTRGDLSAFGPCKHPLDDQRLAGGSSSGPACAVALGAALGALASDTGGSARVPAAYCGVVGLKPSYGRVSRYGLVALASSLDTPSLIAADVRSAALLLESIAGHDPMDATSSRAPVPALAQAALEGKQLGLQGTKLVVVPALIDALPGALRQATMDALAVLSSAGALLMERSAPALDLALPAYQVLMMVEAASNMARFDGIRFGVRSEGKNLEETLTKTRGLLGPEVKRRVLLGTWLASHDEAQGLLKRAYGAQQTIKDALASLLQGCDALLLPATPGLAPRRDLTTTPEEACLGDRFTTPASLAGIPAISLPAGWVDGLPFGLQIVAPAFAEAHLLKVASGLEDALREVTQRP